MENNFELIIPSYKYNFGSQNKNVFKNEYGTWTIYIFSSHNCSLNGIVILDPVFDQKRLDYKQIKIDVECINPDGHNSFVIAKHLEKAIFTFGPTDSQFNSTQLFYEITVKITMPEISNAEEKETGVKSHLKSLFDSKKDADITIKVEDEEIKVHKVILKRSEVFAKLLSDTENETESDIIELKDIKHEVIVEMCRYLYYDEIPKIKILALPLLVAAGKYSIDDLAEKCEKYLMTNITFENYYDVLTTAYELQKEDLRKVAADFVIKNNESIFSSDMWNKLKIEHAQLAMLVMEEYILKNK
ncbi:putative RCC1 and BTB domain-containing protein 2 [Polypedilum vanderplanki]|uniref:RCC1 and BTB domain-containing protein 2 n=1 Tax=Polypedilum vanderplanki TaxID=319348 RepID=A0A9J6CJ15_POLVA|nr:putative RCC1 and BTB domain-containing protein 2 [Polypedilum vanderplanki]